MADLSFTQRVQTAIKVAQADLTAQSAAVAATTIYAVPSSGAGQYRLSWVAFITTAASVSSVLGGAAGFQSRYTVGGVVKTDTPSSVITSAANSTAVSISGSQSVYADASTNIQFLFGYTSSLANEMIYTLHVRLEFMGA